ncbi:MAG: sodium:phosphate symporter, partial [Gemmatimonadetes bacterium]|nr:sodium:phosphate symporter [Actinomycetota bacterium]NIT89404.1 sodium:phosphate symporter [Gemmatimonadota bacterium]NIU33208.1 sodium:phosphate symporter [Gemmatimonadota bacterium]NIW66265.1 sodium:phosphate symporter [Gemmatimonadota bacterium]NIX41171.1 sodium:phosphate symporter [Gemmatimonadota bacterium]
AVRLLGEATGAVSTELSGILSVLGDRPLSALGLGWLFTYVLTNGSVVAALGVTLTGVGPEDPTLTVALVSGSRLGAAA